MSGANADFLEMSRGGRGEAGEAAAAVGGVTGGLEEEGESMFVGGKLTNAARTSLTTAAPGSRGALSAGGVYYSVYLLTYADA